MKKYIIMIVIFLFLVSATIVISTFNLKEMEVTGCELVDQQEIIDIVESKGYVKNTLFMWIANKISPIEEIPFVSKLEIEFISKNKLTVIVYEKSMAGCVEYMDRYIYFDKDGVILESSQECLDKIPCIRGLNFGSWEMGKKLPIDDESKFSSILTITQLIEKYDLAIDGIKFTPEQEILLYYDNITIEIGEGDYLAVQMMNLGSILSNLDGKEGVLHMKDFDSDDSSASFTIKK